MTRHSKFAAAAAVVGALSFQAPAQALTIVLNFVNAPTTDINGVGSLPESFASWGFTTLDLNGVRNATLAAVKDHYLGYPTFGTNALSPLPNGKELNINFTFSNGVTGPGNGDPEWFYMAIGDANPNQGFLGQACLGCVRNASGVATVAVGSIFGSTLTDSLAGLLSLAANDQQRINLLAGTVSHEIGHGLGLVHPNGQLPNPGQSLWSVMSTGAAPSNMPSSERVKEREFAYSEFSTLIQRVGLRDVTPIPEPTTAMMLALGVACVLMRKRIAAV
jgi:PEP-CTERM motif